MDCCAGVKIDTGGAVTVTNLSLASDQLPHPQMQDEGEQPHE